MAFPKFVLGVDTLQFSKGLRFPLSKPVELVQATDRDGSGTLQTEDLGITIKRLHLSFKHLPKADYDALLNWYENIAIGALNPFTYHDENSQTMEVVLLSSPVDFQEIRYQRFSGELLLEVVA